MSNGPNRGQLERVVRQLGSLLEEVVIVGGQVAELLVTDPAATRVRPTDDVDVVVAATTRTAYNAVGERLRGLGFREDVRPGAPLCRWPAAGELVLDVMPISEEISGILEPMVSRGAGHRDAIPADDGSLDSDRGCPSIPGHKMGGIRWPWSW